MPALVHDHIFAPYINLITPEWVFKLQCTVYETMSIIWTKMDKIMK
jgi:hypothetical protein